MKNSSKEQKQIGFLKLKKLQQIIEDNKNYYLISNRYFIDIVENFAQQMNRTIRLIVEKVS